MVSVHHALPEAGVDEAALVRLVAGLPEEGAQRLRLAVGEARALYGDQTVGTGETAFEHGLGAALILAAQHLDGDSRLAALLFAAPDFLDEAREQLAARWGDSVAALVDGLYRLKNLSPLTRQGQNVAAQTEILRKMLLALAADIRVVMIRLASRTQTLRWFAGRDCPERIEIARESLQIYAPLANRLGVWQIKWEIEDLSFRFTEPAIYKRIAQQLDEKRLEREAFIEDAVLRLKEELARAGVTHAEVYGRPKHIYSIWNKMRQKDIDFEQVYDVRALRIIVAEVKDCYTALGIVHALWQPIHGEFDDYISHPKGNDYRSLHTAVMAEDGRALEVQIRTREMHAHAELGVAAHWRYKESGAPARADSAYDDKIAWLRQLLSWRDEITDSTVWVEQFKRAALDDTIYVITPQGRVIDLPKGATPIDFAYRLHTDLGHRCRGAKLNGQLVSLNTPLANGQQVEIVAAKSGGPSRDWLNPGYLATPRARQKVKTWFSAQQEAQMLAEGRAWIVRELQRDGATQSNLEELAHTLGFKNAEAMYLAAARNEIGPRALQVALHGEPAEEGTASAILTARSRSGSGAGQILVVGMDRMLTQLGRCCKPVPPDAISGFVTRGRGVSVHRIECANFRNMAARNPERVIEAQWARGGGLRAGVYACDLHVEANDRQGLLRDISDALSREKVNVTAVKTQSRAGMARMAFTVELASAAQLQKMLAVLGEVSGVVGVRRG